MKNRVVGLDSIRFVMALVVLLGHSRLLNFDDSVVHEFYIASFWNGFMNNIFPGKVAVIVFFVISGFCIHYPYASGNNLNIPEFYSKRLIRIGVPSLIALLLFKSTQSVIWSVVCEIFYYLLYPLVYYFSKKRLYYFLASSVVISYTISFLYSSTHSYNGDFDRVGYLFDWLVGLPIWLLGVLLAQNYANQKSILSVNYNKLLLIRVSVWIIAFICSVLRFHADISYAFTMPIYGVLVYYWLWNEIEFYKNRIESKILVYGGGFSYSIYLIHPGVFSFFVKHCELRYLGDNFFISVLAISLSIIVSWIFYVLIEKQSHNLAKIIRFNF